MANGAGSVCVPSVIGPGPGAYIPSSRSHHTYVYFCTTHFEENTIQPYARVTQEHRTRLSYWFDPKAGLTLEDMAVAVEKFINTRSEVHRNANRRLITIVTIGDHRCYKHYHRRTLVRFKASDCLHDEEEFDVKFIETAVGCCSIL